ncbi:hypothetical protein LTR84_009767 [Exophiala bonariae]|uniref:Xylanolytic transcriptional activator regulatory domain-containing protein n=1 Tax=Exophiala bonariae TaxID=1690606 RepID=A0AAV9NKC3_9EURO|nr:hypothetical protein LTR84_009767 [Exophiala bonariae]
MESDSYEESIRGGATQSLPIFIRILSSFAITGIFDPEFAIPVSSKPPTRGNSGHDGGQLLTWGLPDCITMMDAEGATTSCTSLADLGLGDRSSQCAYEACNLIDENPEVDTLQNTQNSMEATEPWTASSEPSLSTEYDECSRVSNEILSRLRSEISQRRTGQGSYPQQGTSQLTDECFALFGPSSLKKFTQEYWSTWYIHWPVLHRATFQISIASTGLVASLVLLAASYSPDAATRELARYWADAVEAMVFEDEFFGSNTVYSALNGACLEKRLRALQAAHAMCIYQTFEGNHAARRRIRRGRFNEVVAMARELGFQNGRHTDLQYVTEDTFDWKEFILKEELIRTLTYMVVLDSGFIIIYNSVPRVMVPEIQADLVCPEACFQATTESECLHHLLAWISHPLWKGRRMSIADAVQVLSRNDLDSETQQMFTQFGDLNLFVLTSALHSTVFYIRNSIFPFDQASAVLNIMRNWRRIWMLRELMRFQELFGTPAQPLENGSVQGERWKQTGFMKDALQFWLLAQVMLDSKNSGRLDKRSGSSDNSSPCQFDQPSMRDLKRYLGKLGGIST